VEADYGYIDFPMLYYKGYMAYDKRTGEKLPVVKGENSDVRVLFGQGFAGEIRVRYAGMWYWNAAEAVSAATVLGLLGAAMYRRYRIKGNIGRPRKGNV